MNAADWVQQGIQHRKNAAWQQALAAYQQALDLDPRNVAAHHDLGGVYQQLDAPQQAEVHYRAALQIEPGHALTHYELGLFYQAQERAPEAQAELELFLQLCDDGYGIKKACALLKELSGLDFAKCMRCGNVSTLGQFYSSVNQETFCPRCYPASQRAGRFVSSLPIVFLLLMLGLLGGSSRAFYYYGVNLALLAAFIYLAIILHELGHAGASRLLGAQVFEVRLGIGPLVWHTTFRGVHISVTRYPLAGFCLQAFASRKFIRLRRFLVVASGPLFNTLLLLLFAPGFQFPRLMQTYAWRETFVIANGLILLLSLLPYKSNLGGAKMPSDSGQLWQIFIDKQPPDVLHLAYYTLASAYDLRKNAYARAAQTCQDGLELYPRSAMLKNAQAVALLEMGQPAAARELFESLWESFQKETWDAEITDQNRPIMQVTLLNNIAYATLLCEPDPGALQQAFDYARQAFRMAPWLSYVQGTWGAVLVEMGQAQQGLEHLSEALAHAEITQGQARNLAHTAQAFQCLGETDQATEALDRALALDADDYVVQRIKAALGEQEC